MNERLYTKSITQDGTIVFLHPRIDRQIEVRSEKGDLWFTGTFEEVTVKYNPVPDNIQDRDPIQEEVYREILQKEIGEQKRDL